MNSGHEETRLRASVFAHREGRAREIAIRKAAALGLREQVHAAGEESKLVELEGRVLAAA